MRPLKLKIGSPAPDFRLKTPLGVDVTLASSLLEGPVLLDFIRGTWDPDARRRLDLLSSTRSRFLEKKTRVLVVACERADYAARYLEERPGPLTLLVDEDRRVAREYGVLQKFSLPLWNIARPSSFVVDRCGFVRFTFLAPLQTHAADLREILEVLDRI